jgi:hypothetical protein
MAVAVECSAIIYRRPLPPVLYHTVLYYLYSANMHRTVLYVPVEGAVLVAVLVRDVEHVTRKYRLLK